MAWFFKALRLEVLKTVCAYEQAEMSVQNEPDSLTEAVSEEQLTDAQTNHTMCQEEEPRTGEQEPIHDEEAINQEQNASPVPTSDEQECQEQPAPEPEYLMNEDPDAGWATSASAKHWAERLHDWVGKDDTAWMCFQRALDVGVSTCMSRANRSRYGNIWSECGVRSNRGGKAAAFQSRNISSETITGTTVTPQHRHIVSLDQIL